MKRKLNIQTVANLREKAISYLRSNQSRPITKLQADDNVKLIQELEIHQIELELQNQELVEAQQNAQIISHKYIELYDFAPTSLITLSTNGEILELNFTAANLLSKERIFLKNSRLGFFISDDTKAIFNQFLKQLFETKVKTSCQVIIIDHNGLPKPVLITGIASQGKHECLLNLTENSSEKVAQELANYNQLQTMESKKQMDELNTINTEFALQIEKKDIKSDELNFAKNKAEENERLKTVYLANMSHEIRTPMNSILGFSELLKNEKLTTEEQQKYIGLIEKGGHRLLNIINNLVDLSRIESGFNEVHESTCNIKEQITYIYQLFKNDIEAKGMQFICKNLTQDDDLFILSDPEKIYSILINIVKNAIKYTSVGSIEIGFYLESFAWSNTLSQLTFFVKDTGIGISPDNLERIFTRFTRIVNSNTKNIEGAGLGLSISRLYAENLGGRITVDSEIGKGSTFYFTMSCTPLTPEIVKISGLTPIAIPVYSNRKLKILNCLSTISK